MDPHGMQIGIAFYFQRGNSSCKFRNSEGIEEGTLDMLGSPHNGECLSSIRVSEQGLIPDAVQPLSQLSSSKYSAASWQGAHNA